jgi:hypothetical protein
METEKKFFYRYHDHIPTFQEMIKTQGGYNASFFICVKYEVIKETEHSYLLRRYSHPGEIGIYERERWIRKKSKRRFARDNKRDALMDYWWRKRKEYKIHNTIAIQAEDRMKEAELELGEDNVLQLKAEAKRKDRHINVPSPVTRPRVGL